MKLSKAKSLVNKHKNLKKKLARAKEALEKSLVAKSPSEEKLIEYQAMADAQRISVEDASLVVDHFKKELSKAQSALAVERSSLKVTLDAIEGLGGDEDLIKDRQRKADTIVKNLEREILAISPRLDDAIETIDDHDQKVLQRKIDKEHDDLERGIFEGLFDLCPELRPFYRREGGRRKIAIGSHEFATESIMKSLLKAVCREYEYGRVMLPGIDRMASYREVSSWCIRTYLKKHGLIVTPGEAPEGILPVRVPS